MGKLLLHILVPTIWFIFVPFVAHHVHPMVADFPHEMSLDGLLGPGLELLGIVVERVQMVVDHHFL